jgi:HSP20 family protein
MAIMRLYNRNGHNSETQSPVYRFSDVVRDFMGDEYPGKNCMSQAKANVKEENDAFVLSLAVPGLKKSEISLNVEKDMLHISHKSENEDNLTAYNRREFDFRNFERSFRIPETVNTEKIKASYEDGILTLTLPKRDEAIDRGPREIRIS